MKKNEHDVPCIKHEKFTTKDRFQMTDDLMTGNE
ncbi:MAG: hypothetical protein SCARUB_02508 [Candidatus Scalindua rubra]|uniref:Uncharacterized protein n=1 Tax=Candidatus Scalindua rubra TaxID=1872076 RepID=A0A1E3X9S0_9BACT|nr:MAG: hypothetical protein SCARUB_02508 [Candidatus Scalindua rubra]